MITLLKNWYKNYGNIETFLDHKLQHIFVGIIFGLLCTLILHKTLLAVVMASLVVLVLAIAKEVYDESMGHAPLSYHVFDVIVTMLGGVLGILLAFI